MIYIYIKCNVENLEIHKMYQNVASIYSVLLHLSVTSMNPYLHVPSCTHLSGGGVKEIPNSQHAPTQENPRSSFVVKSMVTKKNNALSAIGYQAMHPSKVNNAINTENYDQHKWQQGPAQKKTLRVAPAPTTDPLAHGPGGTEIHQEGEWHHSVSERCRGDEVRNPSQNNVNICDNQRFCNFKCWPS